MAAPLAAEPPESPARRSVPRAQAGPPPAGPALPDDTPDPGEVLPAPVIHHGDIVVSAQRLPGSVDAPQKPVTTLDEEDVESYGADSIADLLTAISPETGSGRGRGAGMPVILVNGQRISSFREIHDYPPEAIRRVEILPEEVALRYGYPPDQRVVNFILKDHFTAKTLQGQASTPDRGGTSTVSGHATALRIDGNRRLNLSLKANHTSPLTEAARGVAQAAPNVPAGTQTAIPGDPDPAANRTLVARASDYVANATWTLGLGKGAGAGSLAINAQFERQDTRALTGLDSVLLTAPDGSAALRTLPGAIVNAVRADTAQAGLTLNKPLGRWQLTATADGGHAVTTTRGGGRHDTDELVAAAAGGALAIAGPLPALAPGRDRIARATTDTLNSLVTLSGRPLRLPGGDATLTVKAGFAWTGLSTQDDRTPGSSRLRRGDASLGVNLGLPVTSRRSGFGAAAGDITLNLSAGVDRLSDFGTLTDWSAGLTWNPTGRLGLQASYIVNQAAPSLAQLGNPAVLTPNVAVFDFATGRSVLVTQTGGGNAALARQQQDDIKLSLNWTLPVLNNSNLIVEYFDNRSRNVSAALPLLTPAVEVAYPGRVTRVGGEIVAIDARPVTLASQREKRVRWGLNLGGNLGKEVSGGGRFGRMMGGGPPPGGAGEGGFGGGHGGHRGGPRGPRHEGRWNLAFYHTWQLTDRVLLAPGTAELDLLGGDAISGSGGVARHAFELEGGAFYKGLGVRVNGTWAAPTHVRPVGLPTSSQLRFGSVTRLNLRLFADLGQQARLVEASPFFKGARISLAVNNLLDSRQRVTDGTGAVPLSFQPDLIDPLGRVVAVELRKLF